MTKLLKLQSLYKVFFYLFLFAIPLQTRKVFLTDYSFYTGAFTEFGTFFLYLSDVLILLTLGSFVLFNWSSIKIGLIALKNKNGKSAKTKAFLAMLALVIWFLISALLNEGNLVLSLFKSLKIAEMTALTFFISFSLKNKGFLLSSLFVIVISGFFQSIVAIYQFIYQASLFTSPLMHKLTGETIISPQLPGIAKVWIDGTELARAYGTFPHPNLLGGFLIFSLFITSFLYLKYKYVYLSSQYLSKDIRYRKLQTLMASFFWFIVYSGQFLALFASFSRSAWLGFTLSALFCSSLIFKFTEIVSRETIIHKLYFHVKELLASLALVLVIIFSNSALVTERVFQDVTINDSHLDTTIKMPNNNTFTDRTFFNNVSRETIQKYPIFGSGPGSSIFQIDPYLINKGGSENIAPWQYQPPHNIYLLLWSEAGTFGIILFTLIVMYTVKHSLSTIVSRETIPSETLLNIILLSILTGIMFIGLFDHYTLTLQQGTITLWTTIGLLLL